MITESDTILSLTLNGSEYDPVDQLTLCDMVEDRVTFKSWKPQRYIFKNSIFLSNVSLNVAG